MTNTTARKETIGSECEPIRIFQSASLQPSYQVRVKDILRICRWNNVVQMLKQK